MCSRRELDIILGKLTDAYQKVYGSAIDKILLYGSYARENYKDDLPYYRNIAREGVVIGA